MDQIQANSSLDTNEQEEIKEVITDNNTNDPLYEEEDLSNKTASIFDEVIKPLKTTSDENEDENLDLYNKQNLKEENIYLGRGISAPPSLTTDSKTRCCQMNSCAKMNSYSWTADYKDTADKSDFPIVEVRFKNTHKDFFKIETDIQNYICGDIVAVESANGHDIGMIALKGELVKLQLQKKGIAPDSDQIKKIFRKAKQSDIDKWNESIQLEKETQRRARIIANELGLSMKIINVEYQGDMSKAIFYYTAEDRVDFRILIKRYAEEFKIRIEMKQIGARQEAGNLGGIGSCGRELCCVSFLHSFSSVSTHAARVQQISLNPQKLAGQCGKLKCCLNYEFEVYTDALNEFPNMNLVLETEDGPARWVKNDILKRLMYYAYDENPHQLHELSIAEVERIIELNREGKKCPNLLNREIKNIEIAPIEFENVVGQDELTRFDKPKTEQKNKAKNKNKNKNNDKEIEKKTNDKASPKLQVPPVSPKPKATKPSIGKPILAKEKTPKD
ncbi:MAG: regulatory iron-sulfur-containing complex subunit RicT [Bacteroidales bacterium]